MRMIGSSLYFVYLLVALGCATPKVAGTSNSSSSGYSEDLSLVRPKVEMVKDTIVPADNSAGTSKNSTYVEPRYAVNAKLDEVLDSIDRINLNRKFVEGFTIQVYSGKREEALNTKKQLSGLLPEIGSEVQFTEPIFRVKAGKYYNWIDAQADFTLIKKYFPAAIIIPDKIPLEQKG